MGPDELAVSAMQIMTVYLMNRRLLNGQAAESAQSHESAEQVYKDVRELLNHKEEWRVAFNEFKIRPHDPLERDRFEKALTAALEDRADLQRKIRSSAAIANPSPNQQRQPWLMLGVGAAIFIGLALVLRPVVRLDLVEKLTPKASWFNLGQPWSLVFGLMVELILIGAGVTLLMGATSAIQRARLKNTHVSSCVNPVPARAARNLQREAGRSKALNAMQAKVFTSAVLWPTDVRQRIVETYIPERNTVRKHVRIEVQLPISELQDSEESSNLHDTLPEDLKKLYFPFLIPPKGALLNSLDVRGIDGTALPVLSYREYLQLTASTLRLLLMDDGNESGNEDLKKAELCALEEISQRRLKAGEVVPQFDSIGGPKRIRSAFHLVDQEGGAVAQADEVVARAETAVAFVEKLREYYAIVVIVAPDTRGRFVISYEQAIVPDSPHKRLAAALGARPLDLFVDLDNASTCQSYHLRIECPDYLYLRRQTLRASRETLQRMQLDAPTVAHTRFQKRLGQAYAHFYARFFPRNTPGHPVPSVKFTFCEVPPASVFRATIAATACLLLIWMVGIVISRQSDPGTDAPAFLLAFPAVVAALLGFDKPNRSLLDSTLHARLSLMATALLSILASALFMAYKGLSKTSGGAVEPVGGWVDWPRITPGDLPVLGMTSWLWIVLTLAALVNAIVTMCAYAVRLTTFTYLRSRNGINQPAKGDKQ